MEWPDVGYMRFVLNVLQLAALLCLALYTHIVQRSKVNARAIERLGDDLKQRIDEKQDDNEQALGSLERRAGVLERRMDVVEKELERMPTHEDLAITHKRMSRVAEQMENMSGQLVAVNRQLGMISEYLLNEKRSS